MIGGFAVPDAPVTTTLGSVCRDGGGSIQTGPFGSQLHASDYVAEGVPVVMPTNIGVRRINADGIARVDESTAERLSRYGLQVGDIVYSRRGDVEKCALVRGAEEGWLCGTGCLRVRLGSQATVSPEFAAYYLSHPVVRDWVVRHAVGATMPNLNTKILSDLPVAAPSRDEQARVVSILGALDAKIDHDYSLARRLNALASLLYDRTVAASRGGRTVRVGDVAEVNALKHSIRSHPERISYIDISSVRPREISQVTDLAYEEAPSRARRVVRAGDTLVSTVRPERRSFAFIARGMDGLTASTGFAVVSPTGATATYLYRAVTSDACINFLSAAASGSAYPAVNPDILVDWKFVLPADGGAAYEAVARPLEDLRWAQLNEAEHLADLRDLLIPNLISAHMGVAETYERFGDGARSDVAIP